MALSLFAALPSSARRVAQFVQRGTRMGLSSRTIEAELRAAGHRVSRSRSILPLMRRYRNLERTARNLAKANKQRAILGRSLPPSVTPLTRKYSYIVRVQGADGFGNPIDRFVTVITDQDRVIKRDIEDAAERMVSRGGQSETVFDVRATLRYGMQDIGFIE